MKATCSNNPNGASDLPMPENLSEWRRLADKLELRYSHACQSVADEKAALAKAKLRQQQVAEAQQVLQHVAQAIQQEAHYRIAAIVTKCLRSVFDEPYQFQITFERKRGRTEARLSFVRGEMEIDPLSAAGGGVIDVAAFALRIACLMLSQPPLRKLIVADEPFKMVSAEYRPRVAEMIKQLADELKIQFILVTHSQELQIGKVVEIG